MYRYHQYNFCIYRRLFFLLLIISPVVKAQDIKYSTIIKNEVAGKFSFDIIGKVGNKYWISKTSWDKDMLEILDEGMNRISYQSLGFLPPKSQTRNKVFIVQPSHVMLIYEHLKNGRRNIEAVKIDELANKIGDVIYLDSSGQKNIVYSENKKLVMLYQFALDSAGRTYIETSLFNENLQLVEKNKAPVALNYREEVYNNFLLANDGTFCFSVLKIPPQEQNSATLDLVFRKPATTRFIKVAVDLKNCFLNNVDVKVDNINNRYVINGLFFPEKTSHYKVGLFTAITEGSRYNTVSRRYMFTNALLQKKQDTTNPALLFKDYVLKEIILKKDGGFIALAENENSNAQIGIPRYNFERLNTYTSGYLPLSPFDDKLNNWNTFMPRYSTPDYRQSYLSPDGGKTAVLKANEVLILNIDSNLTPLNADLLNKMQSGSQGYNFISYGIIKMGQQLQLLYLDNLKTRQIISSQALSSDGKLTNKRALRTGEAGHQFMPRLAKQVSANEVLIPTIFRGRTAFAKINFENTGTP